MKIEQLDHPACWYIGGVIARRLGQRRSTGPWGGAIYNRGPSMRHARQFLLTGRVQGVGFRFFARAAAVRAGLHGWVRNLDDGRVEITAEGESGSLTRFEHTIRHGPSGARVEQVEVTDLAPTGHETGFEIR